MTPAGHCNSSEPGPRPPPYGIAPDRGRLGVPEKGLGRRLIRELVAHREETAIKDAWSMGFQEVGALKGWVEDLWGNYQDLVILEMPLQEWELWWRH